MTGCLAEKYREEILTELPEVDAVVGTTAYDAICEVIDQSLAGERVQAFESTDRLPLVETRRVMTTGGYSRFISRLVKAVINTARTVLFQNFGEITGVFRWSMYWRMPGSWQPPV